MGVNLMKSESTFTFHLDGNNGVDAELLAKTIGDISSLAKLVASEVDNEAYLRMNVTAFRNGSFQIDFSAIVEVVENLINEYPVLGSVALTTVLSIIGIFSIKKHLKGKKAKKVSSPKNGNIEITNSDGNIIIVPQYSASVLKNPAIDKCVTSISDNIHQHNPEGGFSIVTSKENLRFDVNDVAYISTPLSITTETLFKRSISDKTTLLIKSADFIGNASWSFRLNNRTINASMRDEDWLKTVHSGDISIKAGDCISATIEIIVELSETGTPVVGTEKYSILKVHGGIIRQPNYEQIPIDEL